MRSFLWLAACVFSAAAAFGGEAEDRASALLALGVRQAADGVSRTTDPWLFFPPVKAASGNVPDA